MRATLADCAHRHAGRTAVIVGGAPSRLNEIALCPEDAAWFSVNEHGLLARPGGIDYIAALDKKNEVLKGRGAPVISIRRFADILVFEKRLPNSAALAAFAAWAMGCAPIVLIGVECYAGATYAHAPDAESSGHHITPAQHLARWKLLERIAPGAMIRPAGGPLLELWPRYDANEPCTPLADLATIRAATEGATVRFVRRHGEFAAGQVAQVAKEEARRLFAERKAVRWSEAAEAARIDAQADAELATAPANPAAPNVYAVRRERTSPRFARAFARGCGGQVCTEYRPGAWAGFGSDKVWQGLTETRAAGHDWWYGDHAYFGRFQFYRVTKNAFQHTGLGQGDAVRMKALDLEIRPWQRAGRHVLVCPPDHEWAALMGFDAAEWLAAQLQTLRAHTGREIRVRQRAAATRTPLAADLQDCWALVTHASNAAVEALLAGVPVFATDPHCAARAMGSGELADIERPVYPDGREQWAAVLAANQWTLQEIAEGQCWRRIGNAQV